jgi:hypothetical protein
MSLLKEGPRSDDPAWAWWITENEINRQYGRAMQVAGEWEKGVTFLREAIRRTPGAQVGYWSVAAVRLLICFLELHAWVDVNEISSSLVSATAETASGVTLNLRNRTVE